MSAQRLRNAFAKRRALVTYVMGGDGGVETSTQNIVACAQAGADVVEIGFPFSDPIADGPVIQAAARRSIDAHTTLETVFEIARRARLEVATPFVLMGYLNPILAFGIEPFMTACAQNGVDGVIVPDLPPEEAVEWCAAARRHDVGTVFLLAPTSTPEREAAVISASTGFVYFVSVTGVTGTRTEAPDIEAHVQRVRNHSKVPVAVGFGISTPAQAQAIARFCDGVVVGSALVDCIARHASVANFVSSFRQALNQESPC